MTRDKVAISAYVSRVEIWYLEGRFLTMCGSLFLNTGVSDAGEEGHPAADVCRPRGRLRRDVGTSPNMTQSRSSRLRLHGGALVMYKGRG